MRTARYGRASLATLIPLLAVVVLSCETTVHEFDLMLRGGVVVDGTGDPPRRADLAIENGRIAAVGDLDHRRAERVIDATGLAVAPGFIDLHSHADLIVLADRETQERLLSAKILQGVTTAIVGNCGLGPAPSTPTASTMLSDVNGWMTPQGVDAGPLSIGQYLDRLERNGLALNVGTLAPHGPIRISAMGLTTGEPTPGQLQTMRDATARALDAGAFGLSVGLIYPPGMFSNTEELIVLAAEVEARDRLFTAHVRGSSETLLSATQELIEIGRTSGARVHHSHFEAVGERFWPDIARALALEDSARAEGVEISHDVFPYTRAATMMAAIFPPWSLEGGVPKLLERLADPRTRRGIAREIEDRVPEWPPWQPGGWPHNLVDAVGWEGIRVASLPPGAPQLPVGQSLADLGRDGARDPFDVVVELMLANDGRVGQFVAEISGDEENLDPMLAILSHPAAAIISDAEDYGRGAPHPAHAGAFARALKLNRERELTSLADLVRRMTGYPASLLGLEDRGKIRVGARADLVVFDPATIDDRATWSEPRSPAIGIYHVLINGIGVVERGDYLGGSVGEVVRAATRASRSARIGGN